MLDKIIEVITGGFVLCMVGLLLLPDAISVWRYYRAH